MVKPIEDICSKEKYQEYLKERIKEHIKENFTLTLPLKNLQNYPVENINEAFDILINSLAKTWSK
jgi:hypothetical protein